MKGFLKIIGLLVMIFLAIPALIAVIFTTGTARIAVKPTFLEKVPGRVIKELPEVVDKAFVAAKQPQAIEDPNARAWVEAASKVNTTPNQLFQQMGIYQWLQTELNTVFQKWSQVLSGKGQVEDIVLDNRPLKQALRSPAFQNYVRELLKHLPPCTVEQKREWSRRLATQERDPERPPPACNPGETATQVMLGRVLLGASNIPDRVKLLRAEDAPAAYVVSRLARVGMWALFLIPLLLLILGASLGGSHRKGSLRWFGISTLIGGLIPLTVAWFLRDIALGLMMMNPAQWNVAKQSPFWTSEANKVLLEKFSIISNQTADPMLTSIATVAGVVCAIGVLFIVLALAAPGKESQKA